MAVEQADAYVKNGTKPASEKQLIPCAAITKAKIISAVIVVLPAVFAAQSAKVIDKGTEAQYTGAAVFDAKALNSQNVHGRRGSLLQ